MTREKDLKNMEVDGNTFAMKVGVFTIVLLALLMYGIYYVAKGMINAII